MRKILLLIPVVAVFMMGCGNSEASATKNEEEHFRNPSKTPPAGASPGGAPAGASYDPKTMGPPPEALNGPMGDKK